MPDIEWNQSTWSSAAHWNDGGEEWSRHWGSTAALWSWVIAPRIRQLLPARRVVEIAPGYGRCTDLLRAGCETLVGIDLNEACVEACRSRFAEDSRLEFRSNDGSSLPGVRDQSIDLVFSFDSLVHVDRPALRSYLHEISRVLAPGGSAFLHHSNCGTYAGLARFTRYATRPPMPYRLARWLRRNALVNSAWRALDVTWRTVREDAAVGGLECVSQELVNWENRTRLIDCFTVLRRSAAQGHTAATGSPSTRLAEPVRNPGFMAQANTASALDRAGRS
jgi:SAM-dependent methyltransferase